MRKILSLISLVSLAGCASAVITKRTFKPSPGGVVKYSKDWFMTEKNREKALSLAADHCLRQGYQILSEAEGSELGPVSSSELNGKTQVSQSQTNYVYIEFRCNAGRRRPSSEGGRPSVDVDPLDPVAD